MGEVIRHYRRWRELKANLDFYERQLSQAVARHEAGGFWQEYDIARAQLAMVQMFQKIVEGD